MTRLFTQSAAAWVAAFLIAGLAAVGAPPVASADTPGDDAIVVNLNTASAEELQLLPGIGEARARAILEARESRGGFRSVDDLLVVKGIGPANLDRIRPHARIEGPTQVGEITP